MKVVIAYAVGAWLILQIGEVTFEPLDLPEWSMRLLVLAAICGFPIALLLAWLIDVRPEGLIFDRPFWRKETAGGGSASWSDVAVGLFLVVMVGTLIYALVNTFMEGPFPEPKEQVYEAENSPPDGSIAVLAFENFDGYQESDYFASGLAEEILNLLAAIPELRVAARTSSFRFRGEQADIREMAGLLNVRHVLEGSVRREGNRIRVTAQLIDGVAGYHDWSKTYDRDLDDVFAIQLEIATAVVNELKLALSIDSEERLKQQPTEDINAYMFYLQGRERFHRYFDKDVMLTARDLFEQALAIDPQFARAWASICETDLQLYDIDNNPARFEQAENACRRASALDPGLQYEVGLALGKLYRFRGWYDQAETTVRELVESNPAEVDAYIELGETLGLQLRQEEAEVYLLKAVDLNRNYWRGWEALASLYYRENRYPEAARAYEMLTRLTPDVATGFASKGGVYWMMGETESALEAYEQSVEIKPSRQAYTNIGLLHYYRGEFETSVAMQKQAVELAPDDHRVWGRLAESYRFILNSEQASQDAYQKAAQLATENLAINEEDALTRAMLGLYQVHLGQTEAAQSSIERASKLTPDDPEVMYYRALIEVALERPEEAVRYITAAYEADSDYRVFIVSDPDLASLNTHADFAKLLGRFP